MERSGIIYWVVILVLQPLLPWISCFPSECYLTFPRSYVAYHLSDRDSIDVDGKLDESAWKGVSRTEDFIGIFKSPWLCAFCCCYVVLERYSSSFPYSPIFHYACGSMYVVVCLATRKQQKKHNKKIWVNYRIQGHFGPLK